MNVAEFILHHIQNLGTDTAFSLTGGMSMHINHAASCSELRMIYCNHEQAVATAAEGYAKAKSYQVPGLAIVTSGPAVTNTITSVASAHHDSVPLFILAGQIKTSDINRCQVRSRGPQETPQLELMKLTTKLAFRYLPDEVDDQQLAKNLALALKGRKGPVFIEIPLDVQSQVIPDAPARIEKIKRLIWSELAEDSVASEEAMSTLKSALKTAEKPLVVLGNGVRIAGLSREKIKAWVEALNIPTLFTWASFDLLAHDHPLNFGCPGGLAATHTNQILQSADLILFLGMRLDLLTTAFNPKNFGKLAKKIIVELDPNEIAKNIDLPNAQFFNESCIGVIEGLMEHAVTFERKTKWLADCNERKNKDQAQEKSAFSGDRLTNYQVAQVLSSSADVKYIVPTASGYAIETIVRFFKPKSNVGFSLAGHSLGSMGLGLPSAIGAAAALKTPVVCIEGDGGLLLNVQELFTLTANPNLIVTIIVTNNGGYQSNVQSQNRVFKKEFGASAASGLSAIRFDLLAASAGLPYLCCREINELEQALQHPKRQLIEVIIADEAYRGPAVVTKFDEFGKPYSSDIGDVFWEVPT